MNYGQTLSTVDSADFDGTNDYMLRGGALTGIADSKTGILSVWLRKDGGDGSILRIVSQATRQSTQLNTLSSNNFDIIGQNAAGTQILRLVTSTTYTAGATWLHILSSWNLAVAGSGSLYVNDVDDKTETTFTDDTIDYDGSTDWAIGASSGGLVPFNGCLAELYFAPGQYLDFSIVANRRRFISANGKPVWLGTNGAIPTGTAPIVYQRVADAAAVATFATNLGTGGNFSITGTLDTGSTSPSD